MRLCVVLQSSEEREQEKLLNLQVRTSLVIFFFFSREKFRKIVNSGGKVACVVARTRF